jgi:hypothetical protein
MAMMIAAVACTLAGNDADDGSQRGVAGTSATANPDGQSGRSDAAQPALPDSDDAVPSPSAVQPAECEHSTGAYRAHLPPGWWTNPEFEDDDLGMISACRFFGPRPFDVTSADRERPIPTGTAIWIEFLDDGCVGYISPVVESHETTVDGFPARVEELAFGKLETNRPETYQYVVGLTPGWDCERGGRYVYAVTQRAFPGRYEDNKATLDDMMRQLVIGP